VTGSAAVIAGIMILLGIVGVILPVLPGMLLCWGGMLVWALLEPSRLHWIAFAVASGLFAVGGVVKYVVPGRRMRAAGVPWSTMAVGGLVGIVGFFVIPVLGLFVGFVAGVYLAERVRLDDNSLAWPSTVAALKGAGLSMLIELITGLLIGATFAAGLIAQGGLTS
jgi:uncharacterized protein YqgC (DUF456 family)